MKKKPVFGGKAATQTSTIPRGRPEDRLLTPDEAADFLRSSPQTLAQWRSQRRGPRYIKLENRSIRYRSSDLENYLVEHSVERE